MAPEFPAARLADLNTSWPLGLSHSISVRPIRPEDADIETEFVRNLSKQSRYNRFLGGGVGLTPQMLEQFTRIDFSRDMALIATVTLEDAETEIGVVRYVRLADGLTCEFAVTVADAWQGMGLGRKLLTQLIAAARSHGIRKMIGEVLATNLPMQNLARSLGFRVEIHPEGGDLRRVTLDLAVNSPALPG